jgi:hypothetical protein
LLAKGTLTFTPSEAGKYYVETRAIESGCVSAIRALATVFVNPTPIFTAEAILASCNGLVTRKDAQLQISDLTSGKRFDYNKGTSYTGNKTFATAKPIPTNGVLVDTLSNPIVSQPYTIRVFETTDCFTDRTVVLLQRDCECPRPPFVVPESQSICDSDTLRTIRGFVDAGITVDWYDEQGNLLKEGSVFFKPTQAGIYYAEARDTVSGCKGIVRMPSYAFINPHPSFDWVVTRGTCDGTSVRPDAKISLVELKNAKRFDTSNGKTYTGNKTFDNATQIPDNGVILKDLANPVSTTFYTVRVFDSTGCFTDSVIVFEPRICECPKPPFVVPESQAVCSGDTLRTVKGFVDSGITVDWYDAPVGGNLLKKGSIFFKPTQAGTYYAEARDTLSNCKSTIRLPSFAFVNELPTFDLVATNPTCENFVAQTNGKISVKNLKNGTKYDFTEGKTYTGSKTFDTAKDIPADSVLFNQVANPDTAQYYTVRVFGEPNCFTDKTITINRFDCNCNPINVTVIPTSFRICENEPFPIIQGFVGADITVDWYDKDGKLLLANSLTFQPTTFGEFFAEGRSLVQVGCVSTNRTKAAGSKIESPTFTLSTRPATCIGDSAKADAQLIIENLAEGERFDYSIGQNYTGNAQYSSAKEIPSNGVIINELPNLTQTFTVRVFNKCGLFKDVKVTLTANNCQCTQPNCFPLQMKRKAKK